MGDRDEIPAIGVEEEYQLVDRGSGELIPNCKQVMRRLKLQPQQDTGAEIQHELHLNQIEMATNVCATLDDVRSSLCRTRLMLIDAAEKTGAALCAAGTNAMAVPHDPVLTPKKRYRVMTEKFQHIARELFIFGCHVHVSIDDRQRGIEVMNRSRRWLPILHALTANSPFWDGRDTGYASYRRELWAQWPMAGPPPHFHDLDDFISCVDELVGCGAIKDETFLYWDVRLPARLPTIEFRGADVMTSVERAVGFAGLVRAIVMQIESELDAGNTGAPIRDSVLAFALWKSARYGTSDRLVDPHAGEEISAGEFADRLLEFVDPALERSGDRDIVSGYLGDVLQNGTEADHQRQFLQHSGEMQQVVLETVNRTSPDMEPSCGKAIER